MVTKERAMVTKERAMVTKERAMVTTLKSRFIVVEIRKSAIELLASDVEARLSGPFSPRAVVLSEHAVRGGLNYRIGVWSTIGSSKHKYVKLAASVFSEIPPENFRAGSKKGLGGWARFLCDRDYTVLLCSGELCKTKLMTLSQNAQKKVKLTALPERSKRLKKVKKKVKLTALPERSKRLKKVKKKVKKEWLLNLFVRVTKALFHFLLKVSKWSVWYVYTRLLGKGACLFVLWYVVYYKKALDLTPGHLSEMNPLDYWVWLTDFATPGLPPRKTTWYSRLFTALWGGG